MTTFEMATIGMMTLDMTVIHSNLKVGGISPAATLVLSGYDTKEGIAVNSGLLFNLQDKYDYGRVSLIGQMADCGMRFDQLAPNRETFRVIVIPDGRNNDNGVVKNMKAMAIGLGDSFILLDGDDIKLFSQNNAYIQIAKMELEKGNNS